jgi:hypothetical protein
MPRQHRFLNLPGETQKNQEGLKLNGLQLVVLLCTHDVNLLFVNIQNRVCVIWCMYVCMYVRMHTCIVYISRK